jgi:hypothetical protein
MLPVKIKDSDGTTGIHREVVSQYSHIQCKIENYPSDNISFYLMKET